MHEIVFSFTGLRLPLQVQVTDRRSAVSSESAPRALPVHRQGILAPAIGIAILLPVMWSLLAQPPLDAKMAAMIATIGVVCVVLLIVAFKSGIRATLAGDNLSVSCWGIRRTYLLPDVKAIAIVPVSRYAQRSTVLVTLIERRRVRFELTDDQAVPAACDELVASCPQAAVIDLRSGALDLSPHAEHADIVACIELARRSCLRIAFGNAAASVATGWTGMFAWELNNRVMAALALTGTLAYLARATLCFVAARQLAADNNSSDLPPNELS